MGIGFGGIGLGNRGTGLRFIQFLLNGWLSFWNSWKSEQLRGGFVLHVNVRGPHWHLSCGTRHSLLQDGVGASVLGTLQHGTRHCSSVLIHLPSLTYLGPEDSLSGNRSHSRLHGHRELGLLGGWIHLGPIGWLGVCRIRSRIMRRGDGSCLSQLLLSCAVVTQPSSLVAHPRKICFMLYVVCGLSAALLHVSSFFWEPGRRISY